VTSQSRRMAASMSREETPLKKDHTPWEIIPTEPPGIPD